MLLDDGIATIWKPVQTGNPGGMAKEEYTKKYFASYYGNKTVGITRFWTAASHNDQADLLIEIQRNAGISTGDRCQLAPYLDTQAAGYYKILEVQHLEDEDGNPVTDLTLERMPFDEP